MSSKPKTAANNVKAASAQKQGEKSAAKTQSKKVDEKNGPQNPEAEESKENSAQKQKATNLPPVARVIANLFKTIAIEEAQVSNTSFF